MHNEKDRCCERSMHLHIYGASCNTATMYLHIYSVHSAAVCCGSVHIVFVCFFSLRSNNFHIPFIWPLKTGLRLRKILQVVQLRFSLQTMQFKFVFLFFILNQFCRSKHSYDNSIIHCNIYRQILLFYSFFTRSAYTKVPFNCKRQVVSWQYRKIKINGKFIYCLLVYPFIRYSLNCMRLSICIPLFCSLSDWIRKRSQNGNRTVSSSIENAFLRFLIQQSQRGELNDCLL